MSEHSWEETKAILDDPYVSADTKQQVLAAYSRNGGAFNEEATDYYEQYNVPQFSFGNDGPYVGYLDEAAYQQAEEESEDAGYRDRQVQDKVNDNQSELDNTRAPSAGGGGVKNSDELFDLAEPALDVFKNFLPIDKDAPDEARHYDSPKEFEQAIKEPFDQQRGIDFEKFLEEAQRLREAHSTLKELHSTTESSLNSLYKDWTGEGANASYRKYSEDIAPNIQEVLEYLEGGAQVIETAVQTVYEACKNKADEILNLHTLTVGSAIPDTARQVMKLARGDFSSQDEVLPVAAWVDAECGTNIESTIRADDCGLNDENKRMVEEECRKWIRDSWNPDLWDNLYMRFKQACENTKEAVDTAWEEMDSYLKEYTSEFPEGAGDSSVPPPNQNPGETQDPGSQTPGGTGPSGTGPSGSGSGGGGTGGGGGTPSTPEVETPKPEDATTPGKNPVTGEDLEMNPETGEPYPIDPETGEAIKDLGDDQDTVTVEKGDHKLEMTEPDAEGQMEISVDDGKGQLKDYKLDFGNGEQGAGGAEGQQGQGGQGGRQGGDFGPQGSGDGARGDEQVYRPGPDGKIHIQDGNLKITAEQPEGPDGPTKVTVDDGNPPPTTYTLGENKQDAGAGNGGGAGGGTARENVSTMPAYEDNPFTSGRDGADGTAGGAGGDGAGAAGGVGAGAGGVAVGGDGASAGPSEAGGSGGDSGGTNPQASGSGGSGGGDAGGAGGGVSSAVGGGTGGESLGAGAETGATTQSAPATAGVGAAPGGLGEPAASSSSSQGTGGGGMGMMGGGMGAMGGAGGGQGGDQERSSNPYRIDGGIFGNSGGGNRISGSLDDEGDRSIRFDR